MCRTNMAWRLDSPLTSTRSSRHPLQISDIVSTVRRTEESLARLKRGPATPGAGAGGAAEGSLARVRAQTSCDAGVLLEGLRRLGFREEGSEAAAALRTAHD